MLRRARSYKPRVFVQCCQMGRRGVVAERRGGVGKTNRQVQIIEDVLSFAYVVAILRTVRWSLDFGELLSSNCSILAETKLRTSFGRPMKLRSMMQARPGAHECVRGSPTDYGTVNSRSWQVTNFGERLDGCLPAMKVNL
jgi:hypothetical protein